MTDRGIDAVERHIGRFGNDRANQVMVDEIGSTQYDLNYYCHELREFVRYRRQGFPTGTGDNYDLWNNAHSATLEEYGLRELDANRDRNLFHLDAWSFLPR